VWSENSEIEARREMFRSPDHYGYLTANYIPFKALTISFSGTYTGSMLLQHYGGDVRPDAEVWSPRFFDANLKISCDFNINKSSKLQLNCGVFNMFNSYQEDFDSGENRDAGYIYGPSLPRSFYAGLKLSL
jgi:outer membrane receptor for ferrienterochelin and colicins